MHLKKWVFAFAAILLLSFPAFGDEIVSLKGGYVVLKPEGDFAVDGNGLAGTRVDLDDDLGFEESEGWQGEAALSLGPFRLAGSYLPLRFSGDGTLSNEVIFNGQSFSATTDVESDLDIDFYDIALAWHVINIDDLPVRFQLGPEISVKVLDADVSMVADGGIPREDESVLIPVPTIGLRSRIALSDYVGLVGRVGYVEYDQNSLLDADAQIEFSPVPLVGIYAGYRYLDMDVDESGVSIDAKLNGFYGGVMIRF